jgi:hypothetical protein
MSATQDRPTVLVADRDEAVVGDGEFSQILKTVSAANDLAHTLDLDDFITWNFVRVLELARIVELELARDHVLASAYDLASARDLARNLNRTIACARDLARDRALVVLRDEAHGFACDLWRDLARGTGRMAVHESQPGHRVGRVAPSAGWLLTTAARLLPVADRARYSEEYRSELWEIADAGAGRRQQVRYSVRQLTRVARLRGAVIAPRTRNASP